MVARKTSLIHAARRHAGDWLRAQTPKPSIKRGGKLGRMPELSPISPGPLFADAKRGADLLSGRFEHCGQVLEIGANGQPWSITLPSERFADWLHSFDWLPDLMAAKAPKTEEGVPAAMDGASRAAILVDGWVDAHGSYNPFVHEPERMTRRLFNWLWLSGGMIQTGHAASAQTARRDNSLHAQMRRLRADIARLPTGLPRLRAHAAATLYGAQQDAPSGRPWIARGLDALDLEIAAQILPDGGHVSRSPEATAEALRLLLILDTRLHERGLEGSKALSRAIDRLGPMTQTLRHADGGLGVFQGGSEGGAAQINRLMSALPDIPRPFAYGPHSGFNRVAAGDSVLLIDTGATPPAPYDANAHLAPLAMELSTAEGRLIVNCGWHAGANADWHRPMRSAAAHSALILQDTSPGSILPEGYRARHLGPVVERGSGPVQSKRKEQTSGIWLECSHQGYKEAFGLAHRRRLFMGADGDDIRGEDSLYVPLGDVPKSRDRIPFIIRFHFHPDIRVSLAQDLSSALLVQNGRSGWRFRTDGGPMAVEPSVYLGQSARPIRAQQIVIAGQAFADGDGEGRDNRVRWSLRRLKSRDTSSRGSRTQTRPQVSLT